MQARQLIVDIHGNLYARTRMPFGAGLINPANMAIFHPVTDDFFHLIEIIPGLAVGARHRPASGMTHVMTNRCAQQCTCQHGGINVMPMRKILPNHPTQNTAQHQARRTVAVASISLRGRPAFLTGSRTMHYAIYRFDINDRRIYDF